MPRYVFFIEGWLAKFGFEILFLSKAIEEKPLGGSARSRSERVKQDVNVLISQDRVPRNTWRVGKVAALTESNNECVPGANVKLFSKEGKKPTIIQRRAQKLYPVEADIDLKLKEEEGKRNIIKLEPDEHKPPGRPCRDAKVLGELKKKYANK